MTQAWVSVVLVVVLLAMLPMGLKWVQRKVHGPTGGQVSALRVVSAVAVGTHQKVVVVEVDLGTEKVLLTLGVSPQSVTCLHTHVLREVTVHSPQLVGQGDST